MRCNKGEIGLKLRLGGGSLRGRDMQVNLERGIVTVRKGFDGKGFAGWSDTIS